METSATSPTLIVKKNAIYSLNSKMKFLFIDEYSMVGCRLLNPVHQRCMQPKGIYDSPFGSMFVYLIGDMRQVPSVLDLPVYQDRRQLKSDAAVEGNVLFDNFRTVSEHCADRIAEAKRRRTAVSRPSGPSGPGRVYGGWPSTSHYKSAKPAAKFRYGVGRCTPVVSYAWSRCGIQLTETH